MSASCSLVNSELNTLETNNPVTNNPVTNNPVINTQVTNNSNQKLYCEYDSKLYNQINKILNQKSTSDSYLTKGNDVRFKLLTNSVIVNASHKLIKNNKLYTGKIQKGNIIKIGTKKQGHWELEILKELEPSIYNVKINFCNKDLSCKLYGKGAIKIVKNG